MKKGRSCSCLMVLVLVFLAAIAGVLFYVAYPIVFAPPPEPKDTEWPVQLVNVGRTNWGDEAIPDPESIRPMGEINKVTIHHDGSPGALPVVTETQIKKRIKSICDFHTSPKRNYADIGYHYIVCPQGRIWEGRSIQYQGAHVQRHNANNIGVLFLGNTSNKKPTEAGVNSLFSFLRYLRQRYEIPVSEIYTHAELGKTECPGKHLQAILDRAREDGTLEYPDRDNSIQWQAIYDRLLELPNMLINSK